jgi:hypothetical protein
MRSTLICWSVAIIAPLAWAGDAFVPTKLVPAQYSMRTDALGGTWQVGPDGSLTGTNNSGLQSGGELYVDGNNWNPSSQMQTPDGSELVMSGPAGSLQVVRRLRLDPKLGVMRFVDIFTNTGTAPVNAGVTYSFQHRYQAQPVLAENGQAFTGAFDKNVGGFVAIHDPRYGGNMPDMLYILADPASPSKPIANGNNNWYNFGLQWALTVPAGQSVALVMGVGQRNLNGGADPKVIAEVFAAVRNRAFIADLPPALRRILINWRRTTSSIDTRTSTIPEDLVAARGDGDLLAMGAGTRLRGEAAGGELTITGTHGTAKIPWANIAAIAGGNPGRLFLRDGQVLAGAISGPGLAFTLSTGDKVELAAEQVSWIVRRDDVSAPRSALLLETADGDRLAVSPAADARLRLATAWGILDLAIGDLAALGRDENGSQVQLTDGSKLVGQLCGDDLIVDTALFGKRSLNQRGLRGIIRPSHGKEKDEADEDPTGPSIQLATGQILMGTVDLPAVHLRQGTTRLPFPPAQAKVMTMTAAGDDLDPGAMVKLQLWNGDTAEGRLEHSLLPVRVAGQVLRIPVADIAEVQVPKPAVPAAARRKVQELIADLGHAQWQKRESATTALTGMGEAARTPVSEALATATDPEVRRRLQLVLDGIK